MAALIQWGTVGQIFVESLVAGTVIVGAVAFGARLVAVGQGSRQAGRPWAPAISAAVVCFLIAAAAIIYGVYFTIDK